jgi:hypothetical protein
MNCNPPQVWTCGVINGWFWFIREMMRHEEKPRWIKMVSISLKITFKGAVSKFYLFGITI